MTVASEIARIQGVKANILDAIAAKGVTVPSGAMLADCPNLISSISGGGEGDIYNVIDYKYYLGRETTDLTDGVLTIKANNSAILLKSVNISSYDEIVFKTKVKYNRANGTYTNLFLVQRINDMCFAIAFNDDFARNNWCMRVANGRLTYDTYAFVGTDSTTFTSLSTLEVRLKKSTGSIVVKINGTEVLNTVALNPIYFGSDVVIGLGAYTDGTGTFAIGDQVYINETFLIADGNYLIGHQQSGGGGFEADNIVNIVPIDKMVVVDANGYIGFDLTNYFQLRGATYYYNYAILSESDDFSEKGLGQVTFYTPTSNVIGGRTYRSVIIGGVEWLAENLDFKFSGLAFGQSGTSSSEPRGNYYQNDASTYGKYGILYNWIAVKYLEDNKSSLIPGWHVPTTAEWDALATAVGGTSIAGTKLKSTTDWSSGAGTDDYGFSALPTGYYYDIFEGIDSSTSFWTATEYDSSSSLRRNFGAGASMNSYYTNKSYQFSVRLVKDSP